MLAVLVAHFPSYGAKTARKMVLVGFWEKPSPTPWGPFFALFLNFTDFLALQYSPFLIDAF